MIGEGAVGTTNDPHAVGTSRSGAGMKSIQRSIGSYVAMAAALAALSACVVNEPETPTRGVVVSGPPPAPVQEQAPPPPSPQAMWVPGYWHWTGMQYAWIPGHWENPPPGTAWAAPQYTVQNGKTVYETGGWRPAGPNRSALR